MEAKQLTAMVFIGIELTISDALEWQGKLWLVPEWLLLPNGEWKTPARLVRVDSLEHQRPGSFGADILVTHSIPRAVLSGLTRHAEGIDYEVLDRPEVLMPVQRVVH